MGYTKANGRREPVEKFIRLPHELFFSPAWRSLSCNARAAWLEVFGRYNGFNNGEIPLSCREVAISCGLGKTTAARAFDELINRGFLTIEEESAFNMKQKKSRRWYMTHLDSDKRMATNRWKRWKLESEK